MAEQRLIDANALPMHKVKIVHAFGIVEGSVVFPDDIKKAPIVDAVPVVRCNDCKYKNIPKCCPFQINGFQVENDWYCPMGVKMEAKDMDVPTKDGGAD